LADSAALAEDGVEAIELEVDELPVIADRHSELGMRRSFSRAGMAPNY
jgi:hypothetical protein